MVYSGRTSPFWSMKCIRKNTQRGSAGTPAEVVDRSSCGHLQLGTRTRESFSCRGAKSRFPDSFHREPAGIGVDGHCRDRPDGLAGLARPSPEQHF